MKKSTVFLLLVLGGFLLFTQSASAVGVRPPRPNPPTVPPTMPQPVMSAD